MIISIKFSIHPVKCEAIFVEQKLFNRVNQFLNNKNKEYDLEERTAKFGEDIIDFIKNVKRDDINRNIISQLARAVTSIGANYSPR